MLTLVLQVSAADISVTDYSENFESETVPPEGWSKKGTQAYSASTYMYQSGAQSVYTWSKAASEDNLLITPKVSGKITFYARCYASYYTGELKVFKCSKDETGNFTRADEISITAPQTTEWTQITIDLGEETAYLGLNLSYIAIDNFTAERAYMPEHRSVVINKITPNFDDKKVLNADATNHFNLDYTVNITNNGNVPLQSFKLSLVDGKDTPLSTQEYTEELGIGQSRDVQITATVEATDYYTYNWGRSYYVVELLGNTSTLAGSGIKVQGYTTKFAVYDTNPVNIYQTALTSPTTISFGNVSANTTKTFYIKNDGAAPLQVTDISCPVGYNVSETAFTVNGGEVHPVDVTLDISVLPYGVKKGDITITATGVNDAHFTFVLQATGTTRNPAMWYETFDGLSKLPVGWYAPKDSKWKLDYEGYGSSDLYVSISDYKGTVGEPLITPLVKVGDATEKLSFEAQRYSSSYKPILKVSYSADRKNWIALNDYTSELTEDFKSFSIDNIPVGEWYIRFEGLNVNINNISGYTKMDILHDCFIANENIPATAVANHEYITTVTVANILSQSESITAQLIVDGNIVTESEPVEVKGGDASIITLTYYPHTVFTGKTVMMRIVNANKSMIKNSSEYLLTVAAEETGEHTHVLRGKITDGVHPLGGVNILLQSTTPDAVYQGTTADDGSFNITVYQADKTYTLTASKEGYFTKEQEIVMADADLTLAADITLADATGINVQHIDIPTTAIRNNPYQVTATLYTGGALAASDYSATFYLGNQVVKAVPVSIAANSTHQFNFSLVPHQVGNILAYVEFKTNKNKVAKSSEITVVVSEESAPVENVEIGKSVSVGRYYSPICTYDPKGQTEILYTKEQLADLKEKASVKSLVSKGYIDYGSATGTVKVWMANTESSIISGSSDVSDMTLVYDGPLTLNTGGSKNSLVDVLNLQFTTPFVYTGKNIRIVTETELSAWVTSYFMGDNSVTNQAYARSSEGSIEKAKWKAAGYLPAVTFGVDDACHLAGKITSALDNTPLKNVQIAAKKGDVLYTTSSKEDGTYDLTIFQSGSYDITITHDGYDDVVVNALNDFGVRDFTLQPNLFKNVIIDENIDFMPTEKDGVAANFTVKRSLNTGWNTLVLPFNVADISQLGDGLKAYAFTDYTEEKGLHFAQVTSLEANIPYIIYSAKALDLSAKIVKATLCTEGAKTISKENVSFVGNYSVHTSVSGNYGVTPDGYIRKGGTTAYVTVTKAYFIVPSSAHVALSFDDDVVTDIESIKEIKKGKIYDLRGHVFDEDTDLPKGIYIKNGKKYIVK